MLDLDSTALPWSVVLLTSDDDLYQDKLQEAMVRSIIVACVALVLALALCLLSTLLLTRPIENMSSFMRRVSLISQMTSSQKKKHDMADVQRDWADGGSVRAGKSKIKQREDDMFPLWNGESNSSSEGKAAAAAVPSSPQAKSPSPSSRSSLQDVRHGGGSSSSSCFKWTPFVWKSREVQYMEQAFTELLNSWAGYDELEALNHSKRQFIRCKLRSGRRGRAMAQHN
jgi:hypothetical protein